MMFKITRAAKNILRILNTTFSSNIFFWLVIAFFVIEATWVAVSFRFPMLFDERYHLGTINYFTTHLNPIPSSQSTQFDAYGNIAYSSASIYHYLMSFPYRLVQQLPLSFQSQVIIMRILNILMAATGLVLYRKVFLELRVSKPIANLSIFFFSIVPLFIFISATISYDNMLFPLTALFLLQGIKIVQNKNQTNTNIYLKFIATGLLSCLVKFTFLPLFVVGIAYVLITETKKLRKVGITKRFIKEGNSKLPYKLAWGFVVIMLTLLGFLRYGVAVIKYGSPIPDCGQVLSEKRCTESGIYTSALEAKGTKNTRIPDLPQVYTEKWAQTIALQLDTSGSPLADGSTQYGKSLPLFALLMTASLYVGVGALLFMWRSINKTPGWYYAVVMASTLVLATWSFNMLTYYQYNLDLNVQTRYLLSVMPIILCMVMVATNELLHKRPLAKVILVLVVFTLSTQGAGDIKHIITSQDSWYWGNPAVTRTNNIIRHTLEPLIKELP